MLVLLLLEGKPEKLLLRLFAVKLIFEGGGPIVKLPFRLCWILMLIASAA